MPGSINPESGIYQYAYDDPRAPMHDVLNLLADSVHNIQKMNLAEQSQLADLIAALQSATAAAYGRVGLSANPWNQTSGGVVPLSRVIHTSGGLAAENDGIRVATSGAYQLWFDARVVHNSGGINRGVAFLVNGANVPDATFNAYVNGVDVDINISVPVMLNAGDLVQIDSSASSSAYPSTWIQGRTRLSVVRM